MIKFDNFIIEFSKNITILKSYEYSKTLKREHVSLFEKLLNILSKRNKFALDQDCWEELYKRSLYFYKYNTNINGIPSIFVTKHNDIVPWYCKVQIDRFKDTIWHLDSHSDLNPVKHNKFLPKLYNDYLKGKPESLEQIGDLVWDIGAANSGIIYTTGVRDYIWGMPSWLPDKQMSIDYYLYGQHGKDKSMVSNDKLALNSDVDYKKGNLKGKVCKYTRIQTGKLSKNSLINLYNSLKRNGQKYILDIDLDYIVCNGESFDKKNYFKEQYDLQSYKRTIMIKPNQSVPRDNNYKSTELIKYTKTLNAEVKLINGRIKKLLKIIKYLQKKGLTPSHISICDSTNIKFENCKTCNSISNGYVPTHLALYVHTKVISGLKNFLKITA